jgi:hypothetical protein
VGRTQGQLQTDERIMQLITSQNDQTLPNVLTNKDLFWNKEMLHNIAKQAFRNFKPQYVKQVNEEKATAMAKNQHNNRWTSRRSEVFGLPIIAIDN